MLRMEPGSTTWKANLLPTELLLWHHQYVTSFFKKKKYVSNHFTLKHPIFHKRVFSSSFGSLAAATSVSGAFCKKSIKKGPFYKC